MPQRKNKGLGRGLDALFTEFDETATADETVVELNLDDIRSNPYPPRKTFDETSLSEHSDSIRKQGVFNQSSFVSQRFPDMRSLPANAAIVLPRWPKEQRFLQSCAI